jgi:uncharacterized integral membrane protein (TIGR00698 family)
MDNGQNDYSWVTSLNSMEGASDVVNFQAAPAAAPKPRDHPLTGVLLAVGLSVVALWVSTLPFWPFTSTSAQGRVAHPIEPVMIALLLGMLLSNLWGLPRSLQPGIKFSIKKLLPLGIILLGARLHFGEMMKVGLAGLGLTVLETVVALSLLLLLARWMKLPRKLGVLLGVGTAICGGTAIVATAPVIEAEEKDVAFSIATVTLLGLLGMFLLPAIGHLLDLTSRQFGVWAGLAIHQTPQVVAAGYAYSPFNAAYSPLAGDTAVIVKMTRVCLLAPVVFILGLVYARRKAGRHGADGIKRINYLRLFPTFILGFAALAWLNTLGLLPDLTIRQAPIFGAGPHTTPLASVADQISRLCILISMGAVGLETRFSAMKQTGPKPIGASFVAVVVVAVLVLLLIKALGL